MEKHKNKIGFWLFLTSVLTFFLLWIFLAEPITKIYVKKVKESDINVIYSSWEKDLNLEKFWDTYSLLKEKYYSLDWVKKSDLVDWAISWMIDSIWDKHSEFMSSKDAKSFNDSLSWDFEWIWAVVEKNLLWVEIDRILKGSPAKKHWLKKWDIIVKANNTKLEWLSLSDAVDKIKWPAWTSVILKLIRAWEKQLLEKKVIRAKIKIPTVETKTFANNKDIWYISLNMYWENSASEFETALKKFKNKKGLIIDLRDNWGGFLQASVQILSNFVKKWDSLVEVKWKEILNNVSYPSINSWFIYKWKIVVLINWNSASASEIMAWTLRDYKKAILIWTKTYWKWSVQEAISFKDGSQIKFTTAKWFTPNWTNIDENGIKPDIFVDFEKQDYDFEQCMKVGVCDKDMKEEEFELYDRQLEEAKKVLNYFIDFGSANITVSKFLEKYPKYREKEESNKGLDIKNKY